MIRIFYFLFFISSFVNAQTAFISGDDTICANGVYSAEVSIAFTGVPPYSFIYNIDGIAQSLVNNIYDNPYIINTKKEGIYTLQYFSDANLIGSMSGQAIVTVLDPPIADFKVFPDTLSTLSPTTQFISQSLGEIYMQVWDYGDNTMLDTVDNPFYMYPTDLDGLGIPSIYQARLIVYDLNGCLDTAMAPIYIEDEFWMYIPNSFTPDNNKINDKFCIEFHSIRENSFLFNVYNINGDLMYSSSDPNKLRCSNNQGWEGDHYQSKEPLISDTYLYEIYFQDFDGWKHKEFGTIILVR